MVGYDCTANTEQKPNDDEWHLIYPINLREQIVPGSRGEVDAVVSKHGTQRVRVLLVYGGTLFHLPCGAPGCSPGLFEFRRGDIPVRPAFWVTARRSD
jgi:hypothetical protein